MHFLTAPSIKFPKQAQTPPYGRQTVPLFLTEIKYSPPKMPKAGFLAWIELNGKLRKIISEENPP